MYTGNRYRASNTSMTRKDFDLIAILSNCLLIGLVYLIMYENYGEYRVTGYYLVLGIATIILCLVSIIGLIIKIKKQKAKERVPVWALSLSYFPGYVSAVILIISCIIFFNY